MKNGQSELRLDIVTQSKAGAGPLPLLPRLGELTGLGSPLRQQQGLDAREQARQPPGECIRENTRRDR